MDVSCRHWQPIGSVCTEQFDALSTAIKTIDTRHTVETAEGARLHLTVAGPVVRGLAWSIDFLIRLAIFFALLMLLATMMAGFADANSAGYIGGIVLLAFFLISTLYTVVFEAATGTTPGKRVFKLTVVHDNATPLSLGGSVIRNLLRIVDILPTMYFLGLITTLVDNRFRRLGDLAAGSLVIYQDSKAEVASSFSHTNSSAPPNGLTRAERLAIVDFAERSEHLSRERQHELAAMLSHLMDANVDPVETLKCWAEWILRGQTHA